MSVIHLHGEVNRYKPSPADAYPLRNETDPDVPHAALVKVAPAPLVVR